jgi:mannose-6-phosphate isomerase-like protein (cupin superfamily)
MIVNTPRYMIRSLNSNDVYWEQEIYPAWTPLRTYRPFPNQRRGAGVEPHYHDADEIWLFTSGRGEVWLNDQRFPVTPNTVVYTPMGTVHRFQMFTDFENVAMVTRLERQRRPIHITVEEDGPPVPSVPGFVVPGEQNRGPIAQRGTRCPLSELRLVELAAGDGVDAATIPTNEHWAVVAGSVRLAVEDLEVELVPGDVALLRAGTRRLLAAERGARLALARE